VPSLWLDGFEAVELKQLNAPENVLCTARCKADSGQLVLHVLSRDYDRDGKSFNPLTQVKISFEKSAITDVVKQATIVSYDVPEQKIPVGKQDSAIEITLPELTLWSLVIFD
jgi:hypothetical protein